MEAKINGSKSSFEMVENGNSDVGSGNAVAPFTAAEEAAVIRKLDYRLLPLVFVLYSLSVLDRSNLGNAKLAGMETDIDLGANNYAWLGTAFYISCEYTRVRVQILSDSYFYDRYPFPVDHRWMEAL